MSLNGIIEQTYLPEVKALSSLIEQFLSRWKSATTDERQKAIEGEAVAVFERLLALSVNLRDVGVGDHPESIEMFDLWGDYDYLLRLNSQKLASLTQLYLNHFNTQQVSLMELVGQMKRIRQKSASLALWNRSEAKFVLAEHFLNFDSLDTAFTSLQEAEVETSQGVVTLPIRNRRMLQPSRVRIGGKSNGNPGNSNIDVTTNNLAPANIINGDANNWFEYERLDSGPAELTLNVEFGQPQIVNSLALEPVNLGQSLSFDIVDIIFSVSKTKQISIRDLVGPGIEKDFWTVKPLGADTAWTSVFLPVKAKNISIKLRQSQSYPINMISGDNRAVLRERFAIALQAVSVFRIEYEQEGGINSKIVPLNSGLYSAVPHIKVWPTNLDAYDSTLEVSFDDGETWEESALAGAEPGTVLMKGDEDSFLWRMSLARDNEAFGNIQSFLANTSNIVKPKTILRTVSRFLSPADISLPEKPQDGNVVVIQPRIGRRGERTNGVLLGEGTGNIASLPVPFSVVDRDIELDSVRIMVDRAEHVRVNDNTLVGPAEWAFSDDFREVLFPARLPTGSQIRMIFDHELMSLEERSDGYYHNMNMLFDPDKNNIDISYLPRSPVRVTTVLSRDRKVINLGYKNILDSSWSLTSADGTAYTRVTTRREVFDAIDQDYFVDFVNGILYLADDIGSDLVKVTFTHMEATTLDIEQFDIVIEDNLPWGVRIKKDAFVATTVTETISSSPIARISVLTGEYTTRSDPFNTSNTAKTLTHDCVVRGSVSVSADLLSTTITPVEVEFEDGKSEFLGLIPMNVESTSTINSGVNTYVTFTLASGGLWYQPFDVIFTNSAVFITKLGSAAAAESGSLGDYYIANNGLVTVNVGATSTDLLAGIEINYYYRDPSFDPSNKYSLDYERGIIYSNTDQKSTATVTYKSTCYKVAYDIAQEVDDFSYNARTNIVSVRTEGLQDINSLVKVIWTEPSAETEIEELKDFFSPMVAVLAFRFN